MSKEPENQVEIAHAKGGTNVAEKSASTVGTCNRQAFVEVEMGFTLNLGNYQSSRVSVRAAVPVNGSGAMDMAYTELEDWVAQKTLEAMRRAETLVEEYRETKPEKPFF